MKVQITFEVDDDFRRKVSEYYSLLWLAKRVDCAEAIKKEVQTFIESFEPEPGAGKEKELVQISSKSGQEKGKP